MPEMQLYGVATAPQGDEMTHTPGPMNFRVIDKAVEQNRLIKQCAGNHDWKPIDPIFPGDKFPLDRECRRCRLISSTTRNKPRRTK